MTRPSTVKKMTIMVVHAHQHREVVECQILVYPYEK